MLAESWIPVPVEPEEGAAPPPPPPSFDPSSIEFKVIFSSQILEQWHAAWDGWISAWNDFLIMHGLAQGMMKRVSRSMPLAKWNSSTLKLKTLETEISKTKDEKALEVGIEYRIPVVTS